MKKGGTGGDALPSGETGLLHGERQHTTRVLHGPLSTQPEGTSRVSAVCARGALIKKVRGDAHQRRRAGTRGQQQSCPPSVNRQNGLELESFRAPASTNGSAVDTS